MSTFLSFLFGALLLIMGAWTVIMGGIGAILGPRRQRSRLRGFVYGFLLGPIGWAILCMRPRPISRGRHWAADRLDRPRVGRRLEVEQQQQSLLQNEVVDASPEVRDDLRY